MNTEDKAQYQSVRSVERAISLLEVLERTRRSMRLTELASEVKISPATARRLLLVLEAKGLIQRERERYQIGYGVISLAQACLMESLLRRISLPPANELSSITNETVAVYVRQGFQRIMILRVEGIKPLSFEAQVGERMPLQLGAGKILASGMPDAEIREFLGTISDIKTVNGATISQEEFLDQIKDVRNKGYYISRAERKKYALSISVPILSPEKDVIAALAIVSMDDRISDTRLVEYLPDMQRAADLISYNYFHG